MSNQFGQALENRRSIYGIGKTPVLSDEKLLETIQHAVKHTPSAFNSQSAKVVVLLGVHQDRLWEITKETLRKIVPEKSFPSTEAKLKGFQSGYGTVLFFDDESIVKGLQEQFPLYKDTFPVWAQHASGMVQLAVWTSLSEAGYGASLQHYNPLIDEEVKATWSIPANWKLIAQMPFGNITAPAGEKSFLPIGDRVKVFK